MLKGLNIHMYQNNDICFFHLRPEGFWSRAYLSIYMSAHEILHYCCIWKLNRPIKLNLERYHQCTRQLMNLTVCVCINWRYCVLRRSNHCVWSLRPCTTILISKLCSLTILGDFLNIFLLHLLM